MLYKQAIQTSTFSVLRLMGLANCMFVLYSLLLLFCIARNRNISFIIYPLSWISSYQEYKSTDVTKIHTSGFT
jgi:hypothetical protein